MRAAARPFGEAEERSAGDATGETAGPIGGGDAALVRRRGEAEIELLLSWGGAAKPGRGPAARLPPNRR